MKRILYASQREKYGYKSYFKDKNSVYSYSRKVQKITKENYDPKTFDEEAASHLDKLKEVAEKSTITKEVGASLKEYITYFGDNMKCYFAVLKLYMLIAGSYDRFMYLYNKQGGKYFTLLKAIAKAANKQINSFLNQDGTVNLDNLDEFAVNMEYKMGEGWTLTPLRGDK